MSPGDLFFFFFSPRDFCLGRARTSFFFCCCCCCCRVRYRDLLARGAIVRCMLEGPCEDKPRLRETSSYRLSASIQLFMFKYRQMDSTHVCGLGYYLLLLLLCRAVAEEKGIFHTLLQWSQHVSLQKW